MFSYAHVPWLKKQQGSIAKLIPLGMDKFRIFSAGIERFTRAGYLYVGMDHFARPNDELCAAQRNRTLHRNFQGYTTKSGSDLLGMGVSSISGVDRMYAQNCRDLKEYYAAIDDGRPATRVGYRMTADDIVRKHVIMRLMCDLELDIPSVEAKFGIDFHQYFESSLLGLEEFEADGLVETSPVRIGIAGAGRLLLRNIAMCFDAYLPAMTSGKPVFSRTV
jgi:oxygen-independent coproporphyrinogen-3 oxidase